MEPYISVQLQSYFNCKLFAKKGEQDKCRAVFKDCGMRNQKRHMYDSDSLPDSNQIISYNEVPFLFPNKSITKRDAISCDGTAISVQEGDYSGIYLLGASFDGCNSVEELTIHYTSGKMIEQKILVREWYFVIANTKWKQINFNEDKCIPFIYAKHLSDMSKRCIYYIPVEMEDSKGKITEIELPFNPDIYVFALTLKRKLVEEVEKK